jgi:organic hydroperoxide reductase OsmC/OhrA
MFGGARMRSNARRVGAAEEIARMATYTAEVSWSRGEQKFVDNRYSRKHLMKFDGGAEVPGSSSPHVVPLPYSDAGAVDPEEAFIASISSCHMLFFLSIAAGRKFRVDRYRDNPVGVMEKNAAGKMVVSTVTLKPEATFSGDKLPTRADIDAMHHEAHAECFIANSVKTDVRCEPVHG